VILNIVYQASIHIVGVIICQCNWTK